MILLGFTKCLINCVMYLFMAAGVSYVPLRTSVAEVDKVEDNSRDHEGSVTR